MATRTRITRWPWTIAGQTVTFALRESNTRDLGEALSPQRAFKRLLGWFPPHARSKMDAARFREMATAVANASYENLPDVELADVGRAVSEGRLLVFTNVCDATLALAPVRADAPPVLLPEVALLEGDPFGLDAPFPKGASTRCEVLHFEVAGWGRRKPDTSKRLLQVVAMPDVLTKGAVVIGTKSITAIEGTRDLAALALRARNLRETARAAKRYGAAAQRKADAERYEREVELSATWSKATSGEALVHVATHNDSPCALHGRDSVAGVVTTRAIANDGAVVRYRYQGPPVVDHRSIAVTPTRVRLSPRGCHGAAPGVDLEVFPGDQRACVFELSASMGLVAKVTNAVNRLLAVVKPDTEVKLAVGGAIEVFEGWRDCEDHWRVENVFEVMIKASITLSFTVTLSAMQLALGVPTALSDLVGDARFTARPFVSLALEGGGGFRSQPPAADLPAAHAAYGKVGITATGGIELGLEGRLGNDVIGVSLTGSATPSITGTNEASFEARRCVARADVQIDAAEFIVTFCTRALIWGNHQEWRVHLWDAHPLLSEGEVVLYDCARGEPS